MPWILNCVQSRLTGQMKPITLFLAFALGIQAGTLPGVIGSWKQVSSAPLPVTADRPLWDELGLQDSDHAVYQDKTQTLSVDAWRLADSTDAMGAFDLMRPADAKPAPAYNDLTPYAALVSDGALIAVGNYLVAFHGPVPEPNDAANMFRSMPRYEHAGLPSFPDYLPAGELPNSIRYIGGPVALKRFFPAVSASAAAFHLGTEAAVADYPGGLRLALFSYSLPAMARDHAPVFEQIAGSVVKRTGPLVAVIVQPTDQNAAERLLAQVRYQATVTTGQPPKTKKDNPGNLLLNVALLILILAGFCLASGLLFGLLRMVFHRGGASGEGEEILALHLDGPPRIR